MRPRIVDFLNAYFHTGIFNYIIPDPAIVYAITFGLGIFIYIRRCKKWNLDLYHASGIALWASVSALAGARVFYLLQNFGYTIDHPEILWELNGATVSWGVYLGGIIGIIGYGRYYKINLFSFLDVLGSVLGIGPLIGRWACFLNGDDYGTLSNMPWSVRYPAGSYPFYDHLYKGLIEITAPFSLAVHPVQIYASLKGLFLFIVFTILYKRNILKPGALFFLFWMSYACCRFILEFFRGDENRGWVGIFSTGQIMSCLIFLFCGIYIQMKYKWKLKNS